MIVRFTQRGEMVEVSVLKRRGKGKLVPAGTVLVPKTRGQQRDQATKDFLMEQGLSAGREASQQMQGEVT